MSRDGINQKIVINLYLKKLIQLVGLTSSCLRTLLIAIGSNDIIMYVANIVGLFAGLIQPAVVSFMSQVKTTIIFPPYILNIKDANKK